MADTTTNQTSTDQGKPPADPADPTYNPSAVNPYVAPTPTTPPEMTAPPPNQLADPSTPVNSGGRQPVFGGGTVGKLGTIAMMSDSILRGAMRGRAQAQQDKVIKSKKLLDGFIYAKKTADDQIMDMVQKPEVQSAIHKRESKAELSDDDKKTLEKYDQAVNASNSAWQGINQIQSNYLFGDSKKSKGKKGSKDAEDPIAMASSQDPETKLKGIFMVNQKLGNPITYQVKDLLSKVQQQQPALAHQQELERLQSRFDQLNAIPEDKLTPEQKTEREDVHRQIENQKEIASPYGKNLDKKIQSFVGADKKEHITWQRPDGTTYETTSTADVRGLASETKPRHAWTKDAKGHIYSVNLDPQTNQPIPGTENFNEAPPVSIIPTTIKSGEFSFTDEGGKTWRVPTTSTTTHPNGPAAPSAPSPSPSPAGTPSATPPASTTTHPQAASPAHTGPGGSANKPPATAVSVAAGASGAGTEPPPTPPVPGARFVGQVETADEKKIHSSLIQTAEKARTLSELLTTNEAYINAVHKDESKATPRQDLALVVAAVRAMNPGSVRLPQKELELEIKAGSWGDRFRRQFDNATTGLLPADQRDDLFSIVKNETTNFNTDVAKDWQANFPNRRLPAHLKRYVQEADKNGGQAPKKGDKKIYQGYDYTYDGNNWVRGQKTAVAN